MCGGAEALTYEDSVIISETYLFFLPPGIYIWCIYGVPIEGIFPQ